MYNIYVCVCDTHRPLYFLSFEATKKKELTVYLVSNNSDISKESIIFLKLFSSLILIINESYALNYQMMMAHDLWIQARAHTRTQEHIRT